MEQKLHEQSTFITLTYNPENCPKSNSISKRELQLFLKRLRKHTKIKFRYFAVGEYGSKSLRPHYHAIVFGIGIDIMQENITKAWQLGMTHVGQVTAQSAAYVAHYTTKKNVNFKLNNPELEPEFTLMSRRPGLGMDWAYKIALAYQARHIKFEGTTYRTNGKVYPIDPYMRRTIHRRLGQKPKTPGEILGQSLAQRHNEIIHPDREQIQNNTTMGKVNRVIRARTEKI